MTATLCYRRVRQFVHSQPISLSSTERTSAMCPTTITPRLTDLYCVRDASTSEGRFASFLPFWFQFQSTSPSQSVIVGVQCKRLQKGASAESHRADVGTPLIAPGRMKNKSESSHHHPVLVCSVLYARQQHCLRVGERT